MIYSLYIYDRHCDCVYYQDWHRTSAIRPPAPANYKSAVHRLSAPPPAEGYASAEPIGNASTGQAGPTAGGGSVRESIFSNTGTRYSVQSGHSIEAGYGVQSNGTPGGGRDGKRVSAPAGAGGAGLPFDEEAKLVYGVMLSLRNMVKKLSGREEAFTSYRTPTYKFHLFETPTNYRFVLLSDPSSDSLRFVLRQIYTGPFVDYVVRNPLVDLDSREKGIDNEQFRAAVDRHMRALSMFGT